jgi:hypothetical protein
LNESARSFLFNAINDAIIVANDFDANSNGEVNLLEFATGQNPHSTTVARSSIEKSGADLQFT